MTTPSRARALLIYGSCVSRDTYEHTLQDDLALTRYVARQSLISAFGRPVEPPTEIEVSRLHAFQRRMVAEDYSSAFPEHLRAFVGKGPGLLMMDIVDERLGVYDLGDGAYVTRSVDLITSGLDAALKERHPLIDFGSDQHLALWRRSLGHLARLVDATDDLEVDVIAPPWAERDDHGQPTPSSYGLHAHDANQRSQRYLAAVREHPRFRVVTIPADQAVAAAEHRWGPAPFHYTLSTYAAIADAMRADDGTTNRPRTIGGRR